MVSLQILSKCIAVGNINLIEDNLLTEEYFKEYEDEYNFIVDHYKKYGNTPDRATFLSKFSDIELPDVTESDRYLVETIREENLYFRAVPVVQQIAKILKKDSNAAVEYMLESIKTLNPNYDLGGIDIISDASQRYDEYMDRREHQDEWFFNTGFLELDNLIHGIKRVEELFVIFARTNQGKSWVLEKICTNVWQLGFNVGYISPEMGASSIGYRFDTLYSNFDNRALMWGNDLPSQDDYKNYIDSLSSRENKFIVATPKDFGRRITVTKLKNWIKQYKLDLIAVDGITYLSDERANRGDNKTTSLTNISEDLMSLSMEMEIPVLVVVQANRGGIVESDTDDLPDLESIRDSDGIAHNASVVISLRQTKDNVLLMQTKKQRIGRVGGKLAYHWDANTGEFTFMPSSESGDQDPDEKPREKKQRSKKTQYKEDVF